MAQSKRLSRDVYDDLNALPAHMVGEIVHGALHAHPRPARRHGRAAFKLGGTLDTSFDNGGSGPGGWRFIAEHELHLGPHIVVPDISGWTVERFPSDETTAHSVVPPDWLCEILSPSTKRLDRFEKLPIYAEFGVKHCWYVDPIEKTLEVFVLSDGAYKIGPTFADSDPVTAVPFEAHTFSLGLLWDDVA